MQKIVEYSEKAGSEKLEKGFFDTVGSDKEILLNDLLVDERHFKDQVDVGSQINDKYDAEAQSNMDLWGHTPCCGNLDHY